MHRRDTVLLNDKTVIHTAFHGEIERSDILDSINEWVKVLVKYKTIRFLIFDYTDATLSALSSNDVITIAQRTVVLTEARNDLIMIAAMAKDLDFGLFRMWKTLTDMGLASISEDQTHVVRSLDDAFKTVHDRCGAQAS